MAAILALALTALAASELNEPVVTAATTWLWNALGIPIADSCFTRFAVSWPLTTDPKTETPATAPSSRLVLVIDAAMPECSGGTADNADEVTGTRARPNPRPDRAIVQPMSPTPA